MGEYESDDSRTVAQSTHQAPGEPPHIGPREDEARAQARAEVKHGVADPEPRDKPTARNALGSKERGFAHGDREGEPAADEQSVPQGK
jgi:hypothetical protein